MMMWLCLGIYLAIVGIVVGLLTYLHNKEILMFDGDGPIWIGLLWPICLAFVIILGICFGCIKLGELIGKWIEKLIEIRNTDVDEQED